MLNRPIPILGQDVPQPSAQFRFGKFKLESGRNIFIRLDLIAAVNFADNCFTIHLINGDGFIVKELSEELRGFNPYDDCGL